MSIDNPLDQDFVESIYRSRRELLGDDLARAKTYIIGRIAPDGTVETTISRQEYGRIWVRIPGDDTGDAVQAINTILQPHEIAFNRPVSVKKQGGQLYIVGKAPESVDYQSDNAPQRPQTVINRSQYNSALLQPTNPPSMVCQISGGMFQVGRDLHRVGNQITQDFTSLIPGGDAIAYTVSLNPISEVLTYTASDPFSIKSIGQAFIDGDLDIKTAHVNDIILGYIRLFAGQTTITRDDILVGEEFLHTGREYGFPHTINRTITIEPDNAVTHAGSLHVEGTLHVDGILHVLDEDDNINSPNAEFDTAYIHDLRVYQQSWAIPPPETLSTFSQVTPDRSYLRVLGDSPLVELGTDPQIAYGIDGQQITIQGSSDTNRICLIDGRGLHLHGGEIILGLYDAITLIFNQATNLWIEVSRNTPTKEITFPFSSPLGAGTTFYGGGFYKFAGANSDFTTPVNFGTANTGYGAHVLIVTGADTADNVTIQVSGLVVNELGTAPVSGSETIIMPDKTTVNSYFETDKKFSGTVTITHISGTAIQCNYGMVKYWDNNNSDFMVTGIDVTWVGGANDANAEIYLRHHRATGWTYNAGSTPTPPAPIASYTLSNGVASSIRNGESGAWKLSRMNNIINGGGSEGTLVEIQTSIGKAFESGTFIMRVTPR
ncbi:MAG: hypothetical protein GTO60_16675 [Gammaproteobacteria bacterium]|nr:hypothetical protein [Gammaproteobacteria bacterium]